MDILVRNAIDAAIAQEVQRAYFPGIIPYTALNTVLDVGAHIGGFDLFVKVYAPDAMIVAVEPDADNAVMWRRNMEHNAVKTTTLYEARLAERWLDVVGIENTMNSGGSGYIPREERDRVLAALHGQPVRERAADHHPLVMTLRDVCAAFPAGDIDLFKIDCEGAEFDILLNAPDDALCRFRWITGEWHGLSGNPDLLWQRLEQTHDLMFRVPSAGGLGMFLARRKDVPYQVPIYVDMGGTGKGGGWTTINADSGGGRAAPDHIADITSKTKALDAILQPGSVEAIRCIHTLEHLDLDVIAPTLAYWRTFLKPGGSLLIVVPDAGALAELYVDGFIPFEVFAALMHGDTPSYRTTGNALELHRWSWDAHSLHDALIRAGYCDVREADDDDFPRTWTFDYPAYAYTGLVGTWQVPNLRVLAYA